MSVKAMADVFEREDIDSSTDRFILLALVDHADNAGRNIFPAVATISKKTGYSERTVQYSTSRLVDLGVLVEDGRGPKGTNRYRYMFSNAGVQEVRGGASHDKGGASHDKKVLPNAPEPSLTVKEPFAPKRITVPKKLTDSLCEYFIELTKMNFPPRIDSDEQKYMRGINELYFKPLREVLIYSDLDLDKARRMVEYAYKQVRSSGKISTYNAPKSFQKHYRALFAEHQRAQQETA